jgi:hypothetical protein
MAQITANALLGSARATIALLLRPGCTDEDRKAARELVPMIDAFRGNKDNPCPHSAGSSPGRVSVMWEERQIVALCPDHE